MAGMNFCRWNYELHKNRSQELTKELVDECFVKFCCLLKEKVDRAEKSGMPMVFGKVSGDAFEIDDARIWECKTGTKEMEYCPADDVADLSTDLFALGLILYELIRGKSFSNEKDILPGLPFEFEDLCLEMEKEGKTSLLNEKSLPKGYEEFGYILGLLTLMDQEMRLKSFEEFPAGEYIVESEEYGTGRKLKEPKVFIVENLTDYVNMEKTILKDGKKYELMPGCKEQLGYTFLKKRVRLEYREV